jgi:hypothetical protein
MISLTLLTLTGCSSLWSQPEPKIVTVTNTVKTTVPIVPHPKQVQLNDIKIYVVSKENYDEFVSEFEAKNGGDAYIAISVKDYENLSLNFAELRRYIEQQKQIIVYYEEAVKPEEITPKE